MSQSKARSIESAVRQKEKEVAKLKEMLLPDDCGAKGKWVNSAWTDSWGDGWTKY